MRPNRGGNTDFMLGMAVGIAIIAATGIAPGCATTAPTTEPAAPKSPASIEKASRATRAPKLVVLIVLDQLGSWVLDQQLPLLSNDSVIRRAYEDGAYHVAEYPFACTQTAPGHASLATGVTPAVHGIVSNAVYDPERGLRWVIDDRQHAVIGDGAMYASPTALRSETVADILGRETNSKARIVGISIKSRSAVLPIGQTPTIAVFYDAAARGMTTSTYYAPRGVLPAWLRDFREANPLEPLLQLWEPADPTFLQKHLGPDDAAGETFPTFPHDPRQSSDPWSAFSWTPESSEYLLAGTYAAVKAERMGLDEVPDFLMLSISGTDTVGHNWGARSWEYADNLQRIDRALTRFVKLVEARGPVAFVLTADHGVADLPERAHSEGRGGGRLDEKSLVAAAERAADEALGEGDWIAGYVPPLFTYTASGKARLEELTKALRKAMPRVRGVEGVYDAHAAAKLRSSSKELEALIGASLPDDAPGDLYLVTEPGWFDAIARGVGTNHGSPWEYDRRVPVLMWGTAIERKTGEEVQNVLRVATTLAALLDVPSPQGAPQTPLPGTMQLPN